MVGRTHDLFPAVVEPSEAHPALLTAVATKALTTRRSDTCRAPKQNVTP
jgi:hypothetical protein